jgi:ABC-2 type transport system ATP-binding protein
LSTSTATGATLTVRAVSKRFGSRTALAPVSFELEPGQLVGLIGPNGEGKTTLLSILAGVSSASTGEIIRPAGKIGWVPQQPALYSKLTAAENLRLFARLEKVSDPEAAVQRMLRQTALDDRADDEVGSSCLSRSSRCVSTRATRPSRRCDRGRRPRH